MSEYRNFVHDLAGRCKEILEDFEASGVAKDRDVTLLLAVTSLVLVTPHERLKKPGGRKGNPPHPGGDSDRYRKTSDAISALENKPFAGSVFCPADATGWFIASVESDRIKGSPDEWGVEFYGMAGHRARQERASGSLRGMQDAPKQTTTIEVISCLRNGLCHGNLFATANSGDVDYIVVLSEDNKRREQRRRRMEELVGKKRDCQDMCGKLDKINDDDASEVELLASQIDREFPVKWKAIKVKPQSLRAFTLKWCEWLADAENSIERDSEVANFSQVLAGLV